VGYLGDGEAAALADSDALDGVIYISLYFGTGIASGIVTNAKVLRFGTVSSELGHIVVDPSGPSCVCGKVGCAQAVWRSYMLGDSPRVELVENIARLAITLSQIFPACVITFGGRLLEISDDITEHIDATVAKMAPRTVWSPRIKRSRFGGNAPLIGALNEAARRERSMIAR
jgi:predicted NBD/HSP70 family sugar kinase